MEYNTGRRTLILKEYGRNIQNLVDFIKTIEDKDKRSEYAFTIVDLMKQVTPNKPVDNTEEGDQKYWDDLYIIADFDLDVESPYTKPDREMVNKKPSPMPYFYNKIEFLHYGKNIELLVKEAIKKVDAEEREAAVIYLGKLMKSFYSSWNKEIIDDSVILENIKAISKGELTIDLERVKEENLFEKLYRAKRKPQNLTKPRRPNNRNKPGNMRRRRG